ncbi:hypothetical protein [Hydrogenophaga sp.]|uniref:hypothetical protein n=1 Tax=Hydrogenophaga sp. TaxID=1904254 RepID=UPI003D13635F
MKKVKSLVRPTTAGLHLTFGATQFELFRLDGLLWLRKAPLAHLLGWSEPKDRYFYGRHFGVFSTRVVGLEPYERPGAPVQPCRLFTLWGACVFARFSGSPAAAGFIAWAHAAENSPDAPRGLSAESWHASDMDDEATP